MNYLLAGNESAERVAILISFTKINSEPLIKAINMRLVNDKPEKGAAILNGIPQQNLSRALAKLNEVAEKVENIKALDWAHLSVK